MTWLKIRDAVQGDASAIATIQVKASLAAYRDIVSPSYFNEFTIERRTGAWEGIIAGMKSPEQLIIGLEDGIVRGYAHSGPAHHANPGERTGELYSVYVEPDRWRRGYGQQLLAACVAKLAEADFQSATLRVLAANSPARQFYERNGWQLVEAGCDDRQFPPKYPTAKYRLSIPPP